MPPLKKVDHYKTSMELIPEVAQTIDDKTIGIAFADLFSIYVQDKQHEVGEVVTHPETGYPYECITAYDGTAQQDWTIENRTLWKPWHSRKKRIRSTVGATDWISRHVQGG